MMLQSHGVAGLGNTTVTVAGQQITVDPEGNWVQPVQCYLFASEVWDPGDCTPPSAATLLAANNAANIGGAASPGSVAAATGNMNATDSAAAARELARGWSERNQLEWVNEAISVRMISELPPAMV